MTQPSNKIEYRYVRWKAVLFGLVPVVLGGLMIWIGLEAIDPSWTAQVAKGQWLVNAPVWIRSPVMFATGGFVFGMGAWFLFATLSGVKVVTADNEGIAARTIFGRLRRLQWSEVVDAKKKKNQLILSPVGTDTLSQEIWDRKSVFLDIGMLDAPPGAVEALIKQHKPGLDFREIK